MSDQQPQPRPRPQNPATKERFHTRCCYCLSHTLWTIFVLIITLIMLIILVLYIIFTPRGFRFHVTNANLSQFNYTNTTLRYNMILNITAQNPNKKIKIYYDAVQATALYQGLRFATTDVNMPWTSYLQEKKSSDRFSAVFSGQRVLLMNPKQVSEFNEDNKDGVFPIDVKIRFQYRFRIYALQLGYYYAKGTCGLKVPFDGKTVPATAFKPVTCEIVF